MISIVPYQGTGKGLSITQKSSLQGFTGNRYDSVHGLF